jgi:hypothetical protein
MQGVMRHIQAQLYRSLCYRLADSEALAPLLQRNKVRMLDQGLNSAHDDVCFPSVQPT